MWSSRQIDEETVSDAYVRLGNDFNNVVAAFAAYQIDTSCVFPVFEAAASVVVFARLLTRYNLESLHRCQMTCVLYWSSAWRKRLAKSRSKSIFQAFAGPSPSCYKASN